MKMTKQRIDQFTGAVVFLTLAAVIVLGCWAHDRYLYPTLPPPVTDAGATTCNVVCDSVNHNSAYLCRCGP